MRADLVYRLQFLDWGKMVSLRRVLGTFLLVLMPMGSASAGSCSSWLSSFAKTFTKRWADHKAQQDAVALNLAMVVYEAARDNDDISMGAIGLMQAASVILQNNPHYKNDIEAFRDVRVELARVLSIANQNNSPVRDAYLKIYTSPKRKLRQLSQDVLKTLLPTALFPAWRLLKNKELSSASIRFPLRSLIETNRLVVERDEFLEKALFAAEHFQGPQMAELLQPIRSRTTWMRSLRPVLLSALLWFANIHPLSAMYALTDPKDGSDAFHALHYLSRLENVDERFDPTDKKITLIFDSDFPKKTFSHPVLQARAENDNVVDVWKELDFLRARSREFENFAVSNPSELEKALESAEDSDVIYVVAHGWPGEISIGDSDLSDLLKSIPGHSVSKTKEKGVVFISCLYGQKTGACTKDEPWVVNGIRLAGDQTSAVIAASTNNLAFQYFGDKQPRDVDTVVDAVIRQFKMTGLQTGLSSVGLMQWMIVDRNLLSRDVLGSDRAQGFRVYEADTGEETFHEVPESEEMKLFLYGISAGIGDFPDAWTEEQRKKHIENSIQFLNALVRSYKREGEDLFEGSQITLKPAD